MRKNKKMSKLFKWMFFLPVSLWTFIGLITLIPDDTIPPEEILTFSDFILTSIMLIIPWFIICIIISKLFYYLKKKFRKEIKNNKKILDKNKEKNTIDILKINNIEEEKVNKKNRVTSKNDLLYELETYINSYEFGKLANYFPQIYWSLTIPSIIAHLLIACLIAILFKSISLGIVFFIVPAVYCMIDRKINIQKHAEKEYNNQQKKYQNDEQFILKFYNDYFERISETISYKIKYNEITKCIETEKNIYLLWKNQNKIINLLKENCNKELIEFIYAKINNENIYNANSKKSTRIKKYHNPKIIKNIMLIIFVLTLCSLFIASSVIDYVNDLNNAHGDEVIMTTWIYWCFLPIPIISIVLGCIYNGKGIKCKKNVIAGIIMGILLLLYGTFSLSPTHMEDYSKIFEYREIIGVNIPNKGDLEIINWGTYFEQDKTEYVAINIYYDEEDTTNLEMDIKNSSNWFLSKKVNSDLKIFIPITFVANDNTYYSIYNKTLNEYNIIPSKSGNYECYVMKYNISEKKMVLHKFIFNYVNEIDISNDDNEKQFIGTIIEVNDNTLIVEPDEGTTERKSSDKIIVKKSNSIDVVVGNKITITYNGLIEESYPAQISAIKIEIIK